MAKTEFHAIKFTCYKCGQESVYENEAILIGVTDKGGSSKKFTCQNKQCKEENKVNMPAGYRFDDTTIGTYILRGD